MKTLDQIEARIPINATTAPGNANAVHVISTPGSYYLTGDVQGVASKDGILIEASNVTLDLNGYSLKGLGSSLNGIGISRSGAALTGLTIRNGFITGFGQRGIYTVGTGAIHGLTMEDLTIACVGTGLRSDVAGSTIVRRVLVRGGSGGIQCAGGNSLDQIEDSMVSGITGEAIVGDVVERCQVGQVTNSGLVVISGSRISHCRVASVSGTVGLVGIYGEEVNDCVVSDLTLTAAGPVDGVTGDLVTATRVQNLISAGGNVRGIAQRNAPQGIVNGCSVASLKTTGSGTVTGIDADSVTASQISRIGYESSTGVVTGINFGSLVSDCSLQTIGHAGVTSSVNGIYNSVTNTGTVTKVTLQTFKGAGTVVGIRSGIVDHANVTGFVQNGSGFTGNQAIAAQSVSNCTVSNLVANTSIAIYAIFAENVTDTRVDLVSNDGGTANGINGTSIVNCSVSNLDGIGIGGTTTTTRISGCSVANAGVLGIQFGGSGGVLDDNTVTGCPTGIQTLAGSGRVVVRGNSVSTCTTRYSMSANSAVGPIVTATGIIASTNPFANFSD
ncbi:hypothetical protein WKV53_20470 [Luteolibacter sp. Y139]|uniref:Right handed beta helix domain-containing protein n=2 Tax=Luteolibacter soli TaxID=3135280 RepID=A0ABU9AYP8_9BACT